MRVDQFQSFQDTASQPLHQKIRTMNMLPTPNRILRWLPRDYWHVREPIGTNFTTDTLRGYYIDMRGKTKKYRGPSRDGFPLRHQNGESWQLLPVTVTQMALGHYESWLVDSERADLDRFLTCADWLTENHGQCPDKKDGWSYHFDHRRLGIQAPFISAMGQGQGISVLCRAHQETGNPKYLDTAKQALEPFYYTVEEGGVLGKLDDGVLFEEYPCQPYSHVLNGHIFAAWGLHDYAIHQNDTHVAELFRQGAETLSRYLPRYDVGTWSRYGLFPHPQPNFATPIYHELHIAQLRAMYTLTRRDEFVEYADRWEKQLDNWYCFGNALYRKIRFKLWLKRKQRRAEG